MLEEFLGGFGTWFDAYLGDLGYIIQGVFLEILEQNLFGCLVESILMMMMYGYH